MFCSSYKGLVSLLDGDVTLVLQRVEVAKPKVLVPLVICWGEKTWKPSSYFLGTIRQA